MKSPFNIQPRYVVGIDISPHTIKIAGLRQSSSQLEFYAVSEILRKESDEFILDFIQKTLKSHNAASGEIYLNISHDWVSIRRIELPFMPAGDIAEALRWQTKERLPFDIEKSVIDFRILREYAAEDRTKKLDVMFVALPREIIERYVQMLKRANLNVAAINVSPFGIENLFRASGAQGSTQSVLVIDIGHAKTDLAFYKNKMFQFIRTIPIAASDITNALRGPIPIGEEKVEFSPEEADSMLRRLGIPYEPMTLENHVTSVQILTLIRGILERFSKEIARSIDYYISEVGGDTVETAYLTGGGACIKNMVRYLGEELNMPVKVLEIPKAVRTEKALLKPEDAPLLPVAVGVALNYIKKVNLLPQKYRFEKAELVQKMSLRVLSFFVASLFLLSFLFIRFKVDDYEKRLKSSEIHLEVLSQVRGLSETIRDLSNFLATVKRTNLPLTNIMKEISIIIPKNMVLASLFIDSRDKRLSITGEIYEGGGQAEEKLTKFTEQLEASGYFKDAQVTSVMSRDNKEKVTAAFSIECLIE